MIIKFNKYRQREFVKEFSSDYDELLQSCENEFDEEWAEFELDWYLQELMNLYYNGGTVHRIVKLPDMNKINRKELGNHWVTDKGIITRVIGNLEYVWDNEEEYDNFHPYLITAKVKPKEVDVKTSLGQFYNLPQEGEMFIENGATELVNIEPYKN